MVPLPSSDSPGVHSEPPRSPWSLLRPLHSSTVEGRYGPFHSSGPHTLFLRRMLAAAAAIGVVPIFVLSQQSVAVRKDHAFAAFDELYELMALLLLASGVVAAICLLCQRWVFKNRLEVPCLIMDRLWQTLGLLSMTCYALLGTLSILLTKPIDPIRLVLFTNQEPLQYFSMVFIVISVAVLSLRAQLAMLIFMTCVNAIVPTLEAGGLPSLRSLSGSVLMLCFTLAFVAGASWLLEQSIALDSTQLALHNEELAARGQRAANEARRQTNNFIHDHILSVLIPVAAGVTDRQLLRTSARKAVEALDNRADAQDISSTEQLFDIAEKMARELDGAIKIIREVDMAQSLPQSVGEALVDATREALVNSLRHAAGPDCPEPGRTLRLTCSRADGVTVSVCDNGRGFDVRFAEFGRLGIRHSIRNRMETAGGEARILTAPGAGTIVRLSFRSHPASSQRGPERRVRSVQNFVGTAMESRSARMVGGYAILAHLYQLLAFWDVYTNPWVPTVAFFCEAFMVLMLLWTWPGGILGRWATATIPLVGSLANCVVLLSIPATGWPENESWSLGFTAMLCWGLVMRGRVLAAWTAMGLLILSTLPWVLPNGLPRSSYSR